MFKALVGSENHTAGRAGPIDEAAVGYPPGVVYRAWDATPLPVEVPEENKKDKDGREDASAAGDDAASAASGEDAGVYTTEWTLRPKSNTKPQWKTELEDTRERILADTAEDLKLFPRPLTYALGAALHDSSHTAGWDEYAATAALVEKSFGTSGHLLKLRSYMDAGEGAPGQPHAAPTSVLDSSLFTDTTSEAVHNWASGHVLHLVHQLAVVPGLQVGGVVKQEFLRTRHWKEAPESALAVTSLVETLRKAVRLLQHRKEAHFKLHEKIVNTVLNEVGEDPLDVAEYNPHAPARDHPRGEEPFCHVGRTSSLLLRKKSRRSIAAAAAANRRDSVDTAAGPPVPRQESALGGLLTMPRTRSFKEQRTLARVRENSVEVAALKRRQSSLRRLKRDANQSGDKQPKGSDRNEGGYNALPTPDDLFSAEAARFDFEVYDELAIRACHMVTWERTHLAGALAACEREVAAPRPPHGERSALAEALQLLSPQYEAARPETDPLTSPQRRRSTRCAGAGDTDSQSPRLSGSRPSFAAHRPSVPEPFSMVSFTADLAPPRPKTPRALGRRASHAQQPLFVGERVSLEPRRLSTAAENAYETPPFGAAPVPAPVARVRYTTRVVVRRLAADVARRPLSHVAQPLIDFLEPLRDGYCYLADVESFFELFGPFNFAVRNFLMFARMRSYVPYFNPDLAEKRLLRDDAEEGAFVTYPIGFGAAKRGLGVSWVEYTTDPPSDDERPAGDSGGIDVLSPGQLHENVFGVLTSESPAASSPGGTPRSRGAAGLHPPQWRRRPRAPSSLSIGSSSWGGDSGWHPHPPGRRGGSRGSRGRRTLGSSRQSSHASTGAPLQVVGGSPGGSPTPEVHDTVLEEEPAAPVVRKVVRHGSIANHGGVMTFSHGEVGAGTVAECIICNEARLKTPMGLPYDIPWMYDGLGDGLSPLHRAVVMNRANAVAAALRHETFTAYELHAFKPHSRLPREDRPCPPPYEGVGDGKHQDTQDKIVDVLMQFGQSDGSLTPRPGEDLRPRQGEGKKLKRKQTQKMGRKKTVAKGLKGKMAVETPAEQSMRAAAPDEEAAFDTLLDAVDELQKVPEAAAPEPSAAAATVQRWMQQAGRPPPKQIKIAPRRNYAEWTIWDIGKKPAPWEPQDDAPDSEAPPPRSEAPGGRSVSIIELSTQSRARRKSRFSLQYHSVDHTTQHAEDIFERLTRTEVKYLLVDLLGLKESLDDNAFCKLVWDWGVDSDEDLFDYCVSQDFPEDHPLNVFGGTRFLALHKHPYATRLRRAYLDFVAEYYETRVNHSWTALHMALHTEQPTSLRILQLLLGAGANPNHCDSTGRPPLFYAILKRDLDAVRFLLAHNASYRGCGEPPPLLVALDTKNGDPSVEVVRLLAEVCPGGADIPAAIACCNQRLSKEPRGSPLARLFAEMKTVLQDVRRRKIPEAAPS